ncbi:MULTISPECIES: type II toxin-antitoxin system antitoxin HipB [Vibrio]|uniref:Type II toxin-antitoxin system antitoxin HipB n=2 Tax=Vibrio TaxID=662 RepID=A0A368LGP5_9VIBR|nr:MULTISPECIES: type II toxin-antitoxin system antitoxin HipB [Vibrio]RCS69897.1 type II toxin-antitoxin system antitoxin HipB [Vibrio casei]SJN28542.1 HipB protein [Vibrio casei]
MIYSPKQLADMMLLIRQKNGWTQLELAKKVGIKQATISNFENNPNKTTLSTFFKLAQAMDISLIIQEKSQLASSDVNDDENW